MITSIDGSMDFHLSGGSGCLGDQVNPVHIISQFLHKGRIVQPNQKELKWILMVRNGMFMIVQIA